MSPAMIAACCRTISEVEAGGWELPWISVPSYCDWSDSTITRLSELRRGRTG